MDRWMSELDGWARGWAGVDECVGGRVCRKSEQDMDGWAGRQVGG